MRNRRICICLQIRHRSCDRENRVEVVATLESQHLIRMGSTVGRIVPPHASSLGKAIAAFQPEEVRERLVRSYGIHRFTEHTVTDEVEPKREFERVRSRGYSTDQEGSVLEGCCFGVLSWTSTATRSRQSASPPPRYAYGDEPLRKRQVAAIRRVAESVTVNA